MQRKLVAVLLLSVLSGAVAAAPTISALPAPANKLLKLEDDGPVAELQMMVGESRVFPAPGVARIAVGNGSLLTANAIDEREVILFANGIGSTTLFVWTADGRRQRLTVNIAAGDVGRVAREVGAFLEPIPNARVSIVGDKVIVEGEELSDNDRDKVAELAKRYPQIVNFTNPVGWEQMVQMDVKVVEFPVTELRELGLKWNPVGGAAFGAIWSPFTIGNPTDKMINIEGDALPIVGNDGPAVAPKSPTVLSAVNMGLTAKLNMLQQNGHAVVLAEPQLSARSGYKASFLAGGEFPYSVATVNGVTVQFKPYGIKLDVEPKVGRNGVVRATVDAEVSSIDTSVSSAAGPALLTRKTRTEFNVRNGETIVLSGLIQRSSSTDIDKVPLLGDIPLLGQLFRSKRFQNKETELVVFVTPSFIDSKTPEMRDRVRRTNERLADQLGGAPHLTQPLQPDREPGQVEQRAAQGSSTTSSSVW